MKSLVTYIFIFLLFLLPTYAISDVIVQDMVVPQGKEAMLKAEVKGRFLGKGGEVVEFFVDGRSIGRSLSGGDGFAFKQFVPLKSGIYQIKVRSSKNEGKGLLLSLKRDSRIIFVDVEGSLLERFSEKPRKGSQNIIRKINKKYPVVFLQTGVLSTKAIKIWLKKNDFLNLSVIPWGQGIVFNEITEKGFKIKSVIGGPYVIESAREFKAPAFSFVDIEGSVEVKDWEEIGRRLLRK